MKKKFALAALGVVVSAVTVLGVSPAQAATVGSTEKYVLCDAADGAETFTIAGVTAGDLLVYNFAKFTNVSDYTTSYIEPYILVGDAANETRSFTVADVAALANQAGITDWPLEMNVVVYPAGTTNFNFETAPPGVPTEYFAVGIKSLGGGLYEACPKPAVADAPVADQLPDTGANGSTIGVFSAIAAGLLAAGALALVTVRRRFARN
ncbi:unannotated protein [freshwater metagenome]|uniref:Unannotated protein n=1 Tax=freshwater metagenome TaxID=449393 RepID=A0A6J6CW89_9ZZZZ